MNRASRRVRELRPSQARRSGRSVLKESWQRATLRITNYFKNGGDDFYFVLNFVSLASLAVLFLGMCLESMQLIAPKYMVFPIFAAMFLGLYVFFTVVEKTIAKYFLSFKSTQLLWAGFVAFIIYIAHGQAGDEVNAIFHLDASAFPYATVAATAMMVASWSFWPAVLIASAAFVYYTYNVFRSRYKNVLIGITLTLNLASFAVFVSYQISDDAIRRSNIYQIALSMDFNATFNCTASTSNSDSVAFVGAEQRRALIAPPLKIKHDSARSIFKEVVVPKAFDLVECK